MKCCTPAILVAGVMLPVAGLAADKLVTEDVAVADIAADGKEIRKPETETLDFKKSGVFRLTF